MIAIIVTSARALRAEPVVDSKRSFFLLLNRKSVFFWYLPFPHTGCTYWSADFTLHLGWT